YAAAPSCTAVAISCIFAVPWPAASTCLTSQPAIARASTAMTATTATHVTLEPVTVAAPSAMTELSLVICPPTHAFFTKIIISEYCRHARYAVGTSRQCRESTHCHLAEWRRGRIWGRPKPVCDETVTRITHPFRRRLPCS